MLGSISRAKTDDAYSKPIGKMHLSHNPRDNIATISISFPLTSPNQEHITHAAPMADMAHRVLHLTMEGITSRENKVRKRAEEITW